MSRRAPFVDPAQGSLFDVDLDVEAAPPAAGQLAAGAAAAASPPPDAAPPATLQSVLAPAVFRHPQADREIRLGTHLVGYALRRVRRRSIGFIVGVEGLSVNAPKWVGLRDIEAALLEKGDWILKKLREQQERARRLLRCPGRLARRHRRSRSSARP